MRGEKKINVHPRVRTCTHLRIRGYALLAGIKREHGNMNRITEHVMTFRSLELSVIAQLRHVCERDYFVLNEQRLCGEGPQVVRSDRYFRVSVSFGNGYHASLLQYAATRYRLRIVTAKIALCLPSLLGLREFMCPINLAVKPTLSRLLSRSRL